MQQVSKITVSMASFIVRTQLTFSRLAKTPAGEPSAEVLASVAEKLKNLRTTPSEPVVVTPEGTAVAG